MESRNINETLKELKTEEFIWIIYIGIIALSFYSNYFEKKYFINNDLASREKYQTLLILIFSILIVAYLYFLKSSYNSLKKLKRSDTNKKKLLTISSYIGSLLIFISGVIFLFIAIADEEIDVEIAFN